jgi:hypothetical protein
MPGVLSEVPATKVGGFALTRRATSVAAASELSDFLYRNDGSSSCAGKLDGSSRLPWSLRESPAVREVKQQSIAVPGDFLPAPVAQVPKLRITTAIVNSPIERQTQREGR